MAEPDSLDAGSEPAEFFADLVRRFGEPAYNFAFRLSGNEADARDLVQEAMMRAYEHRESYDPAKPFSSWLYRILHNIYLDGARRYEHGHSTSLDAPPPDSELPWDEFLRGPDRNPLEGMLERERGELIQRALDALPAAMRSAIALCDIEGLSYEEISRVMACPVGTVRSRIHQGRAMMRRKFEEFQDKRSLIQ